MESVNSMDNAIIAQHALAQYDINVVSASPIAQSGAAVFKVEDNHGLLYSLRIHIPKSSTLEKIWTSPNVLDSELVWLDALNRDTGLTLPVPKRNRQGSYVTQVGDMNCTMLSWVAGEQKPYFTNEQEMKSTAEMTAALHQHASKWQPPSSSPSFIFIPVPDSNKLIGMESIFRYRMIMWHKYKDCLLLCG